MFSELVRLRAAGVLSALDEQLALALGRATGVDDPRVLLAIALLSRHVARGHVCLELVKFARGELPLAEPELHATTEASLLPAWPEPGAWLAALQASPLCGPAATSPLVLDAEGRLYFRRHYEHERALALDLRRRAELRPSALSERLAARVREYFTNDPEDLQRTAAELALTRSFCVISGGPGTGKTATVAKLLALIIEEAFAAGLPAPRMALVAPTGKAAVRLLGSLRAASRDLPCSDSVRAALPDDATTIHRALQQLVRDRSEPQRGQRQLAIDLLLVDEASMVDLELMHTLLAAVPAQARVILLGDRDQLASVEAGAVLGDICGVGQSPAPRAQAAGLAGAVVQLTRSYRYAADSGIAALARAIRAGDEPGALAVLDDPHYADVALCEPEPTRGLTPALGEAILQGYRKYLLNIAEPAQALTHFEAFRVLCAHRRGERGVEALNRACARLLFDHGLLDELGANFVGRPLIITENDYRNRLWNGDLGVIARNAAGQRVACFTGSDGTLRELGFGRLPPHQSAFAISVHKSQGSEVDEVALVLPHEPSAVLTRELLYTGVTRARRRVVIHAKREIVAWAIAQRVARATGLHERLYAG